MKRERKLKAPGLPGRKNPYETVGESPRCVVCSGRIRARTQPWHSNFCSLACFKEWDDAGAQPKPGARRPRGPMSTEYREEIREAGQEELF
jgi:hypothetical protein